MKDQKVEILAPAGSYESLVAAVNAGADAVYIGGSRFGARAYANNLDEETMLKAIDYVHLHGVQIYMTVNTLMKEEELFELASYLRPYYERGLDAVIVQDMGAFSVIRKAFPDIPIHASTQMTVTGVYGAGILAGLGASRVVTARELSLKEIKEIHDTVGIEIESFVHGALCYCYSGQCLYSSLVGGRSGNRGRCAQPCRLPYEVKGTGGTLNEKDEKYVLSLKDLCTLDILPDLLEAGIYSLKIEGRMKSPRYTAGVVSIYRKYVDQYLTSGRKGYRVSPEDRRILLDLFDRGGQTDGYYKQHNDKNMVVMKEKPSFREGNESLFASLDERYVNQTKQEAVKGSLTVKADMAAELTLTCCGVSVTVYGEAPLTARNQPVTEEKIEKQMRKTGASSFFFESLEIRLDDNLFIPVQVLNQLRRDGMEALEKSILLPYHTKRACRNVSDLQVEKREKEMQSSPVFTAAIENPELLPVMLAERDIGTVYLDSSIPETEWCEAAERCHQAGKKCFLMMPYIFRTQARKFYDARLSKLRAAGFDGLVLRTLEELGYLKEKEITLPVIFDHTVYQWNTQARRLFEDMGASKLTMPLELNSRELSGYAEGEDLVIYGYLPMMVSAQCIQKTTGTCTKKTSLLYIRDRMGKEFPVKNYCDFCYNVIYNTSPLSLHGQSELVKKLKPASLRLHFTNETESQAKALIKSFADEFIRGAFNGIPPSDFTKGHFKRGVE